MKSKKFIGAALAAFLTIFAAGAQAQTSDSQYVISAKAGGINSATGDVKVRRRGASRFESLRSNDALGDGDTVSTGAGGRVEMRLVRGGRTLTIPVELGRRPSLRQPGAGGR